MGSYTFKWPHAAEEVYVTGTFDDWSKSEKLEKVGDSFEKHVTLPDASKPILYKFVVDGNWTTDHTAAQTKDESGNENNVLNPENIIMATEPAVPTVNTVGPESTTAALAAGVPLEKQEKKDELPGTFPETPAVDPVQEKEFGVAPLPATEGAVNPVKIAPGEKIPEGLASNGINDHVTLDKESYEKSDRIPGIDTSELPPVTGNMIPESSLPIVAGGAAAINSAAPDSSTAALAAAVPLENTKVPEVVKESQEKADAEPEASAVKEEVAQKAKVEDELTETVPEAPSTSEGTSGLGTEKAEADKSLAEQAGTAAAAAAATAAAVGAAAVATALVTKDAVAEKASEVTTQATTAATDAAANLPDSVKQALPASVQEAIPAAATKEGIREEVSPEVPAEVKQSITEAEKSPEAAANTEAVEEKKAVEAELLKEVKPAEPIAEPSAKEEAPKEAAVEEPATVIAVPATTEPAAETAAEEAPAAEVNGAKASETTPVAAAVAAPAVASTASSSKPSESPATTAEKKKKNRLSTIFSKIKSKVSSKP